MYPMCMLPRDLSGAHESEPAPVLTAIDTNYGWHSMAKPMANP